LECPNFLEERKLKGDTVKKKSFLAGNTVVFFKEEGQRGRGRPQTSHQNLPVSKRIATLPSDQTGFRQGKKELQIAGKRGRGDSTLCTDLVGLGYSRRTHDHSKDLGRDISSKKRDTSQSRSFGQGRVI